MTDDHTDGFYRDDATPAPQPIHWDNDDDVEEWEVEYDLFEQEDWPGLIRYRLDVLQRDPDGPAAQCGVGDAYIYAGQYQDALDYLAPLHRQNPDRIDIQWSILNALFGLDKTEDDFDWLKKPPIWRLDEVLLDQCYQYLRPKRKPRSLMDICHQVSMGRGYQAFKEEDLLSALQADSRFQVEGEGLFGSEISVRRPSR